MDSLTVQHQRLRHFSEHQSEHESRCWGEPWATQDFAQYLCVLLLGDGFWGGEVVNPLTRFGHHQVVDGVYLVVK